MTTRIPSKEEAKQQRKHFSRLVLEQLKSLERAIKKGAVEVEQIEVSREALPLAFDFPPGANKDVMTAHKITIIVSQRK